jgi:outer membrane receptor protein involved in Fe transport
VLAGLAPGAYELRIDGQKSQVITVAVGETASVDLALGAAGQQVVITGTLSRKDVRNSEVGTGVPLRVIEAMPQVTRNFLSFADLAPGVRFDVDNSGVGALRGGAQDRNNINIYIDGVSQKNNILRGGASGMDTSRGNPFPQSAVAEYKVISQNYKAEFDQVSATAITAVTKSGTNQVKGEVFWDFTKDSFVAYNPIESQNKANGNDRAKFKQQQYGFSVGGPIKADVAHYFIAYEGKNNATPRNVGLANVGVPIPTTGVAGTFYGMQGSRNQEFKEDLVLAKYDLEMGADQHLDVSLRLRREDDFIAENSGLSAPGNDKTRKNDETRVDLRHTLTRDQFVNEARLGYEKYHWSPQSASNEPLVKWFISPVNLADNSKREVIWTGGSPDRQDRAQKGFLLQDDFTYTGKAGHTIKAGAKFKAMEYDLSGTARSVDILSKLVHNTTGDPIVGLDTANPTADWFLREGAVAPTRVKYKNNQFGLYLQDDWKLNKQLELNLGVRWDYETNPLNNDYVTPAALVTALNKVDITRYGIVPAAGQTYAQSLAKGGININDYISTGSNRKSFYGAVAPRLGFSFDLNGDTRTVLYAGYGRAYDRAMANHAMDELQRNLGTGDQFLIKNDYKTPYSDQFSAGLRQALGEWNGEIGATYTQAKNQFNWFSGDRDPNGGFGNRGGSIDPNWGAGPQGYGMLILGDFISQQKTTTVFLRADKPYTVASGWQAGVTYTYSEGKTTNRDWTDDIFNWGYGKPGDVGGFYPSKLVEKHRLVATGLTDKLLPWGMTLSGKLTLGSGLPYRITACPSAILEWNECHSHYGDPSATRQVDMAVSKGFKVPGGELAIRADVLNLFNTANWNQYNDWGGGPGNPQNWTGGDNAELGKRTGVTMPMRTVKLSLRYLF